MIPLGPGRATTRSAWRGLPDGLIMPHHRRRQSPAPGGSFGLASGCRTGMLPAPSSPVRMQTSGIPRIWWWPGPVPGRADLEIVDALITGIAASRAQDVRWQHLTLFTPTVITPRTKPPSKCSAPGPRTSQSVRRQTSVDRGLWEYRTAATCAVTLTSA